MPNGKPTLRDSAPGTILSSAGLPVRLGFLAKLSNPAQALNNRSYPSERSSFQLVGWPLLNTN